MIVCHCRAVNHTTVLDAIGDGAIDVEMVAANCGAGSVCGGCRPTVQSLLSGQDVAPIERPVGRPRRARAPRGGIQIAPLG
jgi:NAD(P)H-nitrite reductase large subunit